MIIAKFCNSNYVIARGLWQWDYGQKLQIQGLDLPKAIEVHFSLQETGGEALTRIGVTREDKTEVAIPGMLLENSEETQDYDIFAFIYISDNESGETVHKITMPVKARPRPKPFDINQDTDILRDAIEAVNAAVYEMSAEREQIKKNTEDIGILVTATNTMAGDIEIIKKKLEESSSDNKALRLMYDFAGGSRGYAQGTLQLISASSSSDGAYEIYWADDKGALKGYEKITEVTLGGSGAVKTYDFIPTNAIPVGATRIIAVKDNVEKAEYILPTEKTIKEEKLYSFGLLSDVHVDGDGNDTAFSISDFEKALTYFKDEGVNAVCVSGDVTADGRTCDITEYKRIVQEHPTIPVYVARGNHDCFNQCTLEEYTANIESNGLYFEKNISGDIFLFVGMAEADYSNSIFTTEELDWLEEKLIQYKNKRVFLFEHVFMPPVGNIANLYPYTGLSTSGIASKRFIDLMSHYRNVIFCSGHSHLEFELQRVGDNANCSPRTEGLCHRVHTPSCAKPRANDVSTPDIGANTYDRYEASEGYIVDVYPGYIILRGRDFVKDTFLPLAQYIIDTTPITISGNTPITLKWQIGSIDKTTGNDEEDPYNIRTDFISVDSMDRYYLSTSESVDYIRLYAYAADKSYIDYFGSNAEGYVTAGNVGGYESGILEDYQVVFPENTAYFRIRAKSPNGSIGDGARITLTRSSN